MTRKLVGLGLAVMTTLLSLVILWQFRSAMIYFLVSLGLAAAVSPLVKRWARQGLVVRILLAILFIAALGGVGFLLIQGGGASIQEVRLLANAVAVQDVWKLPDWLQGSFVQQSLIARLPPPSQIFAALTGDKGQLVLPVILGFTRGLAELVSAVFVILFMSLYWSLNQGHFERLWLSLLPPAQRNRARDIWQAIEMDLGAYIRSQVIQSVLAGLLLGLGYWALGSPYAVLLGLTGALACLIPMVGAGLAVILPLFAGLLTSVQLSLFSTLYTLVVLIALEVWAKPRLFNHRQYNPILTVFILIALADAFGFIGIIAAPPLSAAIQILWGRLVIHRAASGPTAQISDLKERLAHLSEAIQVMDEPPMPLITSSMERLTRLIEKTEPALGVDPAVETR